jgi:DNA repair protein RecO
MTKTTQGIIIKISDSKEADKIIKMIGQNGEKITFLAKGVKKMASRKAHALELGNLVKISLNHKYNIPLLIEIKLLSEPLSWKISFESLIFLQMVCEILDLISTEDFGDKRIFYYSKQVLYTTKNKLKFNVAIWILYILQLTGNLGDLKKSVISGLPIKHNSVATMPGIIGYISAKESSVSKKLESQIIKTQLFSLKTNIYAANRINLNERLITAMLNLHLDWLEIIIEKPLKTRKLLSKF